MSDADLAYMIFYKSGSRVFGYGNPLTSTWPHLRCDVGLEEGEY